MDAITNAIDEFQEYSFQYNVKIVGVPEVCSDEAASTTSKLCVKLFKEMGENISIQGIDTAHRVSQRNKEVNNVVSEAETTLCGVSQGSVLGPLLFLLYINDIYKSSSLFAFYLFADDTSIILANNNLKELETLVNRELGVNEWLKANKLSLDIKKSNFVIFRPRQKNMPFIPRIRILDSVTNTYANLEMKDYVKYLGFMIDSNLSWKCHIIRIYLSQNQQVDRNYS